MTGAEHITFEASKAREEASVLISRLSVLCALLIVEGQSDDAANVGAGLRRMRLLQRTLTVIAIAGGSKVEGKAPGLVSGSESVQNWMDRK